MICIYVCFRQIVTLSFVATKEKRRKLKPMELVFYGLRCFERGVFGISVSHMLAGIDSHFGSAVQCNALLVHSHLDAANRVTAQHVRWQVRQVHQLWCGPSSTGCCLHQLAAPCHSVGVVQDVQAQTRTCELPASLCIGMRSL